MNEDTGGGRRRDPSRGGPSRVPDAAACREALERGLAAALRGPLTAFVMEADRMARDTALPPAARDAAARIVAQGQRVVAHVHVLLDLVRLEADRLPIFPETVPVTWVLGWAAGEHATAARARAVALDVAPAPEGAAVLADRAFLSRMLGALLVEAIEAAPAGGRVALRVRRDAGGARVRFEVEGPRAAGPEPWTLLSCRLAAEAQRGSAGADETPEGRSVAWVSLPAG
ncbi:MAG: hypothetical protein L0216_02545 [Planctomycetales bacterium]|nr:hypothetical protein [Planctomycetales bacterium]